MADFSNEAIGQTIERLKAYSKRIHENVAQAKALYACFQSLNENRELRESISWTKASVAANLFMHAVLRELMLILVKVFDGPGRHGIEKSDKVTFPIIAAWLAREPVRAALLEKARSWLDDGDLADEHEAGAAGAMDAIQEGLQRLRDERPNREKLLRDFRDGFLAHDLHREIPCHPPLFGHISELLEEIRLLSEATSLAIEGSSVHWDMLDEQIRNSADWLWSRVADDADAQQREEAGPLADR